MGQPDSLYTTVDVSQARNDFRKGLKERMKDYMADIQRLDRKRNAAAEWKEARTVAENEGGEDLLRAADAKESADSRLEALIEEFNSQDERGFSKEAA